jgi:hypothetical protein
MGSVPSACRKTSPSRGCDDVGHLYLCAEELCEAFLGRISGEETEIVQRILRCAQSFRRSLSYRGVPYVSGAISRELTPSHEASVCESELRDLISKRIDVFDAIAIREQRN